MKKNRKTPKSDLEEDGNETGVTELRLEIWSVISFEGCIARGLTYDQAIEEIANQSDAKIAGLCIVTDEAAARIKKRAEGIL